MLAPAMLAALYGCVGSSGGAAPKCMSGRGRLLPAAPGSRWQYKVSDPDTGQYTYTKDLTLGENVAVGGLVSGDAHPLCRRDGVGDQVQNWAIRWERDTGSQWQWLRNQRFDPDGAFVQDQYPRPSALRLDEDQICVGDKWTEDYEVWNIVPADDCPAGADYDPAACAHATQTLHELWQVEAVDEAVDLGALGKFHALVVTRKQYDANAPATPKVAKFTFARNVGKLREVTEHVEQEVLTAWDIAGGSHGGTPADTGPCTSDWKP